MRLRKPVRRYICYNAGFCNTDNPAIITYVAKRVTAPAAYRALKKVGNLKQYKGKRGFVSQAMKWA